MNSFNHYAYGAIGEWLYRVVAGLEINAQIEAEIDTAAPGYKHILIQPQPGGGLTHVRATLNSMYGEIGSAWALTEDHFDLAATLPANTRATIRLPAASLAQVTESGRGLEAASGIERAYQDGEVVVVEIGSGDYQFVYSATGFQRLSNTGKTFDRNTPL